MQTINFVFAFLTLGGCAFAQNYTSYQTGDTSDTQATALGGTCLIGGSTEDDEAMRWFLQRAGGGDVLVLRASGSNGYNDYFYTDLGVSINSVETIVCHNAQSANEAYIQRRIREAEAIWFAGGNQWNYVNYWRGTAIDSLVNEAISQRNVVVGGTSAGMAVLGGRYFTAQNGTISSADALANPYHTSITVGTAAFFRVPYLGSVLTDTHFDNPDRRGRFAVFMARMYADAAFTAYGIACDESTAVCIDTAGIARVFGVSTQRRAYFVQHSCQATGLGAELCAPMQPLHWDRGGAALLVYAAEGSPTGANSFDLNDWQSSSGDGVWQHWAVDSGVVQSQNLFASPCLSVSTVEYELEKVDFRLFPNPASEQIRIELGSSAGGKIRIIDGAGCVQATQIIGAGINNVEMDIAALAAGFYIVEWRDESGKIYSEKFIKSMR